jgi:hypothetical protein
VPNTFAKGETMATTKEQVGAVLGVLQALADVVRASGRVPNGHLYARVMGSVSLDQYNQLVGVLVRSGVVRLEHDELVWAL